MDKIIRLSKRHIDQLALIDWESDHQGDRKHKTSQSAMKNGIIKRFSKKQEIFFGYKQNGELVGYATFKPFFPGHKHCEVYWIAVRKKFQGHGIGRRLMEFIEQHARQRGFRKVCLYTGKDLSKTRRFYEKIGYSSINEFPDYYGYAEGNTTAVLYVKKL